jgi:hypothetical protein
MELSPLFALLDLSYLTLSLAPEDISIRCEVVANLLGRKVAK